MLISRMCEVLLQINKTESFQKQHKEWLVDHWVQRENCSRAEDTKMDWLMC
jgi:hypothetical protein